MSTDTDQLEDQINRSRTALNDTIEQLGGKLSPGQMLDEAMGLAKGQAGELVANLGRQVKGNPLPLLLIGAGIGLMVMNARKDERVSPKAFGAHPTDEELNAEDRYRKLESARSGVLRTEDETHDAFSHRIHEAESKAMELKQNAGEAIDAFKDRVRSAGHSLHQTAADIRSRMKEGGEKFGQFASSNVHDLKARASDAKDKVQSLYDAYPIAAGAIGLAVGAIIGAAAPMSTYEREKLGGVADAAVEVGAKLGEKGAALASKAADKMVSAVQQS